MASHAIVHFECEASRTHIVQLSVQRRPSQIDQAMIERKPCRLLTEETECDRLVVSFRANESAINSSSLEVRTIA